MSSLIIKKNSCFLKIRNGLIISSFICSRRTSCLLSRKAQHLPDVENRPERQ
jgi:hypothetical protein